MDHRTPRLEIFCAHPLPKSPLLSKKLKGNQSGAPSLLDPRVFFLASKLAPLPGSGYFVSMRNTRWTFQIFFIFFCPGGGERGSPRRQEGGVGTIFTENARRGAPGGLGEGGGARGREGVCEEFWGGGAKNFFSGPKFPPRIFII